MGPGLFDRKITEEGRSMKQKDALGKLVKKLYWIINDHIPTHKELEEFADQLSEALQEEREGKMLVGREDLEKLSYDHERIKIDTGDHVGEWFIDKYLPKESK